MHVVYVARDLWEAQLLLDQLIELWIKARIDNALSLGVYGELPYQASRPRVVVEREGDVARALRAVREFEARQQASVDGVRLCASCGDESPENFELCWKCGGELEPRG
ncbi:MAG: DUF2007 domain-containing protein [Myxococcales bacterium]|nr:DUF2007 domain-containing protein [Myxococcales bacterium]